MMRFSRLRLNGFKSFVDPTDLAIADGLTGVVGPNGCGKSNLLEALRWVMGENRPTAMRGGGMEDVIFSGAATRPARHFAEVSLLIDNSDHLAPSGFNEHDQIDIVRRVTRDIGSAYKVLGKDTRARDVQMLFADASTGAHSPALVRQGQIAELINAKPTARRRILEEAAGIAGLYQRRHEAELKLNAAEGNLARIDDVLEQLSSQLQSLSRQARQAARYREIASALRFSEGMLLYRRWKDADEVAVGAQSALSAKTKETAQAETAVRTAAKQRETAEAALPDLREKEAIASAVLQRLHLRRDTLNTEEAQIEAALLALRGRVAQLAKDTEREEMLRHDAQEMLARLEQERTALRAATDGFDGQLAEAAEQAREAAEFLQAREGELAELTEEVARLAARHQSATKLIEDSRQTHARADRLAADAQEMLNEAQVKRADLDTVFVAAQAAEQAAQTHISQTEEALATAEAHHLKAQERESAARSARSEAQANMRALRTEVEALERMLARAPDSGSTVVNEITVDPGFEKAVGAAMADELQTSLARDGGSGWVALPQYLDAAEFPATVEPLSAHVVAPPALARCLSHVGVVDPEAGNRLQPDLTPGQCLVSRDGDLWRWDGLRIWASDATSEGARQLEHTNRLIVLRKDLAAAQARANDHIAEHEAHLAQLQEATQAEKNAREERKNADQGLSEASRALSKAQTDQNACTAQIETQSRALELYRQEQETSSQALSNAQAALSGLFSVDRKRAKMEDMKQTVEAARITMIQRRTANEELRREGEANRQRLDAIAGEVETWKQRSQTAIARIEELRMQSERTQVALRETEAKPDQLSHERKNLQDEITKAEAHKASAVDMLSAAEGALRKATEAERDMERHASDTREARAKAEVRRDAANEAREAAVERILEEQDMRSPQALLESLEIDADAILTAEECEVEVARLRRQRDALGAVNLRAEEDAREIESEHETLAAEKTDVETAIQSLRTGISGLNRDGRSKLLDAFSQVNKNFRNLFKHLFAGGEAELVFVESDDPLNAGLEIMCQPPGKKLSTLSLLSGGEQTLTALALIFAVFLANPAPICVLDEVDAPLDDANVTRFCDLLDEMSRRTNTRFLIITHHAVTMSRMDRLFGITMAEKGVSQLVSVDLKRAEQLVA